MASAVAQGTAPPVTSVASFPDAVLQALQTRKEITIVTGPPADRRATIIWVVVDGRDHVWVRSVRGPRGRWYRDLMADPRAVIDLGEGEISVSALPSSDEQSVQACTEALRAKYAGNASLASMLAPDTLPTTIQLVPR